MKNELAILDKATQAIEKVVEIGEAKNLADKAAAIKLLAAKQGWSQNEKARIAEIEIRATVRLGELLQVMEKSKGGRPRKTGSPKEPVIADLGVSKKQSHVAQLAASVPKAEREKFIEDNKSGGRLSVTGLTRIASRDQKSQTLKSTPLPEGVFDVVLADPPWRYEFSETRSREVENQYPTMSLEDIYALHDSDGRSVVDIFADRCVLFLWATAPKLAEALKVIEVWGFEYKTHAVWDKQAIGMGYWFRGQHELLLVAAKGKYPAPPESNRVSSIITAKRTKHSRKPEGVCSLIESMTPTARRRVELFCRVPQSGWEAWGNEL